MTYVLLGYRASGAGVACVEAAVMGDKLHIEADWFARYVTNYGKWQLATHLLVRMLADQGIDMSNVLEMSKEEVTQLLLEHNRRKET